MGQFLWGPPDSEKNQLLKPVPACAAIAPDMNVESTLVATEECRKIITSMIYSLKVISIHVRLCYVVHYLCPFTNVGDVQFRTHIKHEYVNINTFKLHMQSLIRTV